MIGHLFSYRYVPDVPWSSILQSAPWKLEFIFLFAYELNIWGRQGFRPRRGELAEFGRKDLEEMSADTDSASEDEEDSEEDISGEEEQGPSDQSDGD